VAPIGVNPIYKGGSCQEKTGGLTLIDLLRDFHRGAMVEPLEHFHLCGSIFPPRQKALVAPDKNPWLFQSLGRVVGMSDSDS
jgi:hypothetical protein